MSLTSALPHSIDAWADVLALEARASRVETPCGDAAMVWHIWGEGQPVVLLHGGSGSWNHWVRNIEPLVRAGYQVIAADLPGFGDSAPPPLGFDADVMPHWIELGLQQLIGDQSCDVLAFSFGSMVATLLTACHPARVRRLILAGAPALSTLQSPSLGLRAWRHKQPGPERDEILRFNLGRIMLAKAESIDDLALSLHRINVERENPRMGKRRLSTTDIIVRTLPQIHCPVSGIWGSEDVLYRDRMDVIRPALAHAPDLRQVVFLEGIGHWVQYESAAAFNAFMLAALAEPLKPV